MIRPFPKIWQVGDKRAENIFASEVEITEKIDGSQFNFGKIYGKLYARSKGREQPMDYPDKMFRDAVNFVQLAEDRLPSGVTFHCEYLNKPKHNTLCYNRVPRNFLICFGASLMDGSFVPDYEYMASSIGLESVPVLYLGEVKDPAAIKELLETESVLGGTKIEGIVIKNYNQSLMLGELYIPLVAAKYVSEAFKERHGSWKQEHSTKGRMESYIESFRHEGRWKKAVQHLREDGKLEGSPRDIGALIKGIHHDIEEEEKEAIMLQLWKEFGPVILRKSIAGFPEWYKQQLMDGMFNGEGQVQ